MWLQCQEPVFTAIAQKAIAKGLNVELEPKYRVSKVEELIDEDGRKTKKTYMRSTGYKELGDQGWYLVHIDSILYPDLVAGMDLGPHVLVQGKTRTVREVDYNREYLYFRVKDDKTVCAHCFTQHFTIDLMEVKQ